MEILLFSHDPEYAAAAVAGGVAGVVVDWEWADKAQRQAGRDTEINRGTVADLEAARQVTGSSMLICRINNRSASRTRECELAIEHGAKEIWLPMVRSAGEIEECLRAIDGRAALGVLVETRAGMAMGRTLQALAIARVYIGLQDYRIDTGRAGLFDPIVDGTIDAFRADYQGPLGFAGITKVGAGWPVPQDLLLASMVRLGCSFGVARRSFRADVPVVEISDAIARIQSHVAELSQRTLQQVAADHEALARTIAAINDGRPRVADECAR